MATRSSSTGGALPVVDLAAFFSAAGDEPAAAAARTRATEAVREACMSTGFFRVVNHGVPRELMARALELSAAFFALPDEAKAKVRPAEGSSSSPLPGGYARQPAHSADKNEYVLVFNPKLQLNLQYPAEPAGFRDALEECYAKLTGPGLLIQEILNECMGLRPGFLAEYNADRNFDFLTPLRYFPATSAEETNGICAHEDGNIVTFVLQDSVGGLEVLDGGGSWIPAEPVEGSIIANIGCSATRSSRARHTVRSGSRRRTGTRSPSSSISMVTSGSSRCQSSRVTLARHRGSAVQGFQVQRLHAAADEEQDPPAVQARGHRRHHTLRDLDRGSRIPCVLVHCRF